MIIFIEYWFYAERSQAGRGLLEWCLAWGPLEFIYSFYLPIWVGWRQKTKRRSTSCPHPIIRTLRHEKKKHAIEQKKNRKKGKEGRRGREKGKCV